MTPGFDFRTLDNAPQPRVEVFHVPSGRVIATFPIERSDVQEAEEFAFMLLEGISASMAVS